MAAGSEARFFVQLRYAMGWVTVAAAETRESAAAYAGAAFVNARDESNHLASQVRIVTEAELRGTKGGDVVAEALASIARHRLDLGDGL